VNEAHFKHLESHIAVLMGEVELYDWRITLSRTPCEDGSYANISPTYGQRHALLHVAPDFPVIEPSRANKALVHELLHCHWALVQWLVEDDALMRTLGRTAYDLWFTGFRAAHETAIDSLSLVLAPHLSPLVWPEKQTRRKPAARRRVAASRRRR
jgi:hypothetical protein